jgi:hypothetical protein
VKLLRKQAHSTLKTETIAILENSLMNIRLQLTPKLFGAELSGVLIGDDEQVPNDQGG